MKYEIPDNLCIEIYNYLEKKTAGETGAMFAVLDQEMKRQNIEKQRKDVEDKIRAEIKAEEVKE